MDFSRVNWESVKEDIKSSISNERIWGFGGSEFSEENIMRLEEELELIDNEDYESLLDYVDEDYLNEFIE
jgi:hypothetical protein